MKSRILYIGPLSSMEKFNEISSKSRINLTAAPIVFQNELLKGFKNNGIEIDVLGLPIIPTYPKSEYKSIPKIDDKLESGYTCEWVPSINLPIFKQIERKNNVRKIIREWSNKYKDVKKTVIVYSVFAPVFKAIIAEKKNNLFESVAIVTDLPQFMFSYTQYRGLKKFIRNIYSKHIEKMQGCMDKYIYLTGKMREIVAPNKQYLVVEGVVDAKLFDMQVNTEEKKAFSIMYAGGLNKNFGIENLVEAFDNLETDNAELWLFGAGDAVPTIKEKQKNNSRIKYYGKVERSVVLEKEIQADLLVNVRNPLDEFTKYSFPSKTMEYMLSGTMFMTTKLEGIPDDYFNYVYALDNNSVDCIRKGLEDAMLMNKKERIEFGKRARNYVLNNKNSVIQAKKIIDFLGE